MAQFLYLLGTKTTQATIPSLMTLIQFFTINLNQKFHISYCVYIVLRKVSRFVSASLVFLTLSDADSVLSLVNALSSFKSDRTIFSPRRSYQTPLTWNGRQCNIPEALYRVVVQGHPFRIFIIFIFIILIFIPGGQEKSPGRVVVVHSHTEA